MVGRQITSTSCLLLQRVQHESNADGLGSLKAMVDPMEMIDGPKSVAVLFWYYLANPNAPKARP